MVSNIIQYPLIERSSDSLSPGEVPPDFLDLLYTSFLLPTQKASRPNPFGPEAEPFGGSLSFAEGSVRFLLNAFGVRSITSGHHNKQRIISHVLMTCFHMSNAY